MTDFSLIFRMMEVVSAKVQGLWDRRILLVSLCFTGLFLAGSQLGCGRALKAKTEEGRTARRPETPASVPNSLADSDNDGIPDGAELSSFDDRRNFRRWFTGIAEMQFYRPSKMWTAEQRDCAGLVRFAWREALRKHDRAWRQAMGEGYEGIAPDVRAFTLEEGFLREKLFRVEFGAFREDDLATNRFSEFADAKSIKNHNVVFIGRDRRQAQPGDLLFYHLPWAQKFPYHIMIFLGDARIDGQGAQDWVVYHTGPSPKDLGEVKKTRLSVLDRHPDKRWRPVENNPQYLGLYRLKMLE
jgi:uncharacterized protein